MENITLDQLADPKFRRQLQMSVKSEAVWVAFLELQGLINEKELARQFFNRSYEWIASRIDGSVRSRNNEDFTPEEYAQLSDAFRTIAARLNDYADAIDKAE